MEPLCLDVVLDCVDGRSCVAFDNTTCAPDAGASCQSSFELCGP